MIRDIAENTLTRAYVGGVIGYACAGVDGAIAGAKIGVADGVRQVMMPALMSIPLREAIEAVGKMVFVTGAMYVVVDGIREISQVGKNSCARPFENVTCIAISSMVLYGSVVSMSLAITAFLKLMRF